MPENQNHKIRKILTDWYNVNKRELPWRQTKDPYKIWVSEIILQQTRVNQGFDYYIRFIERFPDIKSLAESDEQEVLRYWQGLGYYSRARNLHKAARIIQNDFNGIFPSNYEDIISLPGIGEYTASAISSFAFNLPYATVDGNIFRVLSRLTGNEIPIDTTAGKRFFTETAQNLLNKKAPRTHNQAIMEFGALQCTPKSPNCSECPLSLYCEAFKLNLVSTLPIKQGKTKVSNRYFNYFFIKNGNSTYLQKRTGNDIWKNLYEFPLIETEKEVKPENLLKHKEFIRMFDNVKISIDAQSIKKKHVLSHRIIHASFYTITINDENKHLANFLKTPLNELNRYPISRLTEKFLEEKISSSLF